MKTIYFDVFYFLVTNNTKEKSTLAVQLLRESMAIKEERLKISKEKLLLQKEKFKYFKTIHSDYQEILSNVQYNVMRLREEIEKMAPSYLI